jgi:hypothetical protein
MAQVSYPARDFKDQPFLCDYRNTGIGFGKGSGAARGAVGYKRHLSVTMRYDFHRRDAEAQRRKEARGTKGTRRVFRTFRSVACAALGDGAGAARPALPETVAGYACVWPGIYFA